MRSVDHARRNVPLMSRWILPSLWRYSRPRRSSRQTMAMCVSENGPGLSCFEDEASERRGGQSVSLDLGLIEAGRRTRSRQDPPARYSITASDLGQHSVIPMQLCRFTNPQLPPAQKAAVVPRHVLRVAIAQVRDLELDLCDVVVRVLEVDLFDRDWTRGRDVDPVCVERQARPTKTRPGHAFDSRLEDSAFGRESAPARRKPQPGNVPNEPVPSFSWSW